MTMDKYILNDDVYKNFYLGGFNIEMCYMGGINEEGEEDLTGCMGCVLTLSETTDINDLEHTVIRKTFDELIDNDYDADMWEETIYNTYPETKHSVSVENYISDMDTKNILEIMLKYI